MPTPFFNARKFVSFVDELVLVHANVFGPNVGVETITVIFSRFTDGVPGTRP
jgi:hypothetical protein